MSRKRCILVRKLFFSRKMLIPIFLLIATCSSTEIQPEINSYSRVSTNSQIKIEPISHQSVRADTTYRSSVGQGREFGSAAISRSPVYVPERKLQNGEAIDHPNLSGFSKFDRAQDRFHPPASFEHVIAHSNAAKHKMVNTDVADKKPKFPVPSYATLPKEVYNSDYGYGESLKKPEENPQSSEGDDFSMDPGDISFSRIPDSYSPPEVYSGISEDSPKAEDIHHEKYPGSYLEKYPKPEVSYGDFYSPSHDFDHDIIYDHPPDHYYEHHVTTTTTEEPEMNDQRLSKKPYSYYYIGKKLWYIPLYFSIYFIIYIAALVLKSIARHKINFPANLAAATANARNFDLGQDGQGYGWMDLTKRILDAIDVYNSIDKSKD